VKLSQRADNFQKQSPSMLEISYQMNLRRELIGWLRGSSMPEDRQVDDSKIFICDLSGGVSVFFTPERN
jgi:hypothetical protein